MDINPKISAHKIARDFWEETVKDRPRRIAVPENYLKRKIDRIALKIGRAKWSYLPKELLIWWYRSSVKNALNAFKFELIGNDNFERYKHLFTKKEKWFHDAGVDKLFKNHLCKDKTKDGPIKKGKNGFNKLCDLNSSTKARGNYFKKKVDKYSGDINSLIISHLTYLAMTNLPPFFKDSINAARRPLSKYEKSQSKILDQFPIIRDGLKETLNKNIDPNNPNYIEIAESFVEGILKTLIKQKPETDQKISFEKAGLETIGQANLSAEQLRSLTGLIALGKSFVINYLNAQINDQRYDPTNYQALLKTVEETDFNKVKSVPDLLKFQAEVGANLAALKAEQIASKSAEQILEYTGHDIKRIGEGVSQVIDQASKQAKSLATTFAESKIVVATTQKATQIFNSFANWVISKSHIPAYTFTA